MMNSTNNKILKVLLVNPPHIQEKGLYPRIVFEPIGLAYIAAYLEKQDFDVEILDAIGESFNSRTPLKDNKELIGLSYEEIHQHIVESLPDIVGISVPFTMRAETALAIASIVKKISKNITTVLGGIHPTTCASECLQNDTVDFVVIGEGEIPMLNIVSTLQSEDPEQIYKVEGLGFKRNGTVTINPAQSPIEELDKLPFPARHLLPMEKYFQASKEFRTGRYGRKFACITTSRGCPFKCTFCVSHKIMGRKWRYRSPANIVAEIESLVNNYGITFFHFEDDNLTLNKRRTERICELIIKRKLKIKWDTPNGIRADTIANEEILRKMKKSGCQHICVAPESGNSHVVKNIIKKNLDLSKVTETVRLCRKVGIKVDVCFVIGMVGETKEQIQDTLDFAAKLRKLGASRCHFHIATPFEGTEVYNQAKEKGYLVSSDKGQFKMETQRIETPDFTVADIDNYFIKGCKLNSVIPLDKIGIIKYLLFKDPIKLLNASFNYVVRRRGGLSS